jgi:oligopeptide transport system permease protein
MLIYALKRLLGAIPTLFIIVTLTFFMMRIAPGGPFDSQRRLPPEVEANIKAAYNLDKPLVAQYGLYLERLAHGDLGPSFKNKDFTVAQLIGTGLPVSLKLGLSAMTLALLIGTLLGSWAAIRQNRWQDYSVMTLAMTGITIPTFVTAPLLTLLFGVYGVTLFGHEITLPVSGWNGGALRNMILPVIVLALPQIAIVALRAAALPLVSYLGPATAAILTGSLIVEQIFGLPGIGRYFVLAALDRDYTMVLGVVVVYAALIVVLNFVADILYAVLDPRVRLS